jgi:hypothetical protein
MQKLEKLEKENSRHDIKYGNQYPVNILDMSIKNMSDDSESEKIKPEHEEMKEEGHQIELKDGYEQDEEYEESEE